MRVTARKQERRYFEPNPPITHSPATLSTYADKPQQHGALLIHPQPAAVLRGKATGVRDEERAHESRKKTEKKISCAAATCLWREKAHSLRRHRPD